MSSAAPSSATPPPPAEPAPGTSSNQGSPVVITVGEDEAEVLQDVDVDQPTQDDSAPSDDDAPATNLQKGRKRKTEPVHLSEENERLLGEWMVDQHSFLYDRGHPDYKNKKKSRAVLGDH